VHKCLPELRLYLIGSAASLILVLASFKLFGINPALPLSYTGDAIVHYNFAKNIEETGWWWSNPRFGVPTGQTLLDFPLTENLQLLIIKLLIVFGFNWYESVNIYFLLTFPLVTMASLYVMQRMGIKSYIALPLSIIYAFLPYHSLRGVSHLFLSGYFGVPLTIFAAYRFAANKPLKPLELVITTLLIASTGAYYTFLGLFFTGMGGLLALVKGADKALLVNLAKYLVLILGLFFLNYLPTFVYTQKYGANLNATARSPRDTEIYGLKLTQLLLPVEDHNLALFTKFQKRYLTYGSALTNENQYSALGLVSAAGFVFLLAWTVFRYAIPTLDKELQLKFDILGSLTLAAVLFATVGGFATLFSTYLNPTFRSVNRISVFIAFSSLLAVGLLLQRIKSTKLVMITSATILLVGLFDQVSLGVMRGFIRNSSDYLTLVKYADKIERISGSNAKIYTLPFGQYPEGSDKNIMRVALLTDTIVWSAGSQKWRAANYWQQQVNKLAAKPLLASIIREGFTGLLINVKELEPMKLTQLEQELNMNPVQDDRKELEFAFYDLRPYAASHSVQYAPTDVFFYVSGNCLYNQISRFYCANNGSIEFENVSNTVQTRVLKLTLEFANGQTEQISLNVIIPRGTSRYLLSRTAGEQVFPIPASVPVWPLNIGYPTFAIQDIKLQPF